MNISVTQDVDIDEALKKVKELLELQEKLSENTLKLTFVTIREFAKMTGWSLTTVQQLYNRPEFPSCDFGKEKIAEAHALLEYFSVPRRK